MTTPSLSNSEAVGRAKAPTAPGPGGTPQTPSRRPPNRLTRLFKYLGPGLITGASDDDPSGIGTYAMAGAAAGYAPLWTALVTFPLMAAVQYLCATIGLVSGHGLAGVLRRHYPRTVLYPTVLALVAANTINAGVDIGAIAAGINLLLPIPFRTLVVAVTVLVLALQIWGSYRLIAATFKWLTLTLLAYIGAAFFARPDWGAVLRGTLQPTFRFDSDFLALLVAILGTTISPYLFFWQASQEAEEKAARGGRRLWRRRQATDAELSYAALDVNLGMFFSNLVMYFIILGTAATLHQSRHTAIQTATEAAEALTPLAGRGATVLFALGLIGSGFLAVPILTASAAYAVCEALVWPVGLNEKPASARGFYAVLLLSTAAGAAINFLGVNPVQALFWTAVINGFVAPPLLVVILLVASNRAVMGRHVSGFGVKILGWITTALMFAAAAGLVLTWAQS